MAKAKKVVTVKVSPNTTVIGPDGHTIYRAGDEFTIDDAATVAQWVAAGSVVKVPVKRR